jgi:membrane-associated protease RseP (regulator of RpoE activity)
MRTKTFVLGSLLSIVGWLVDSPLPAQPALERLERQIRQRVGAADSADDSRPGYLGLVADDQKDRGRGVRVLEVRPNSPAAKAGLRKQDLITNLAGVRVRQMTDLADVLATLAPDKTFEVELIREGRPLKVQAMMGRRPAEDNPSNQPEMVPLPTGEAIPAPPEPGIGSESSLPKILPSPRSKEARVEELQRRVDELEARVAELERKLDEALKKDQTQ